MDPRHLGFPDEETMACEDGLVENHFYLDLRGYGAADFEQFWTDEDELLRYTGDFDSDEADADLIDNAVFGLGLDPGVATTVLALCAIGAVPVTSCSGGVGHYETHPLVLCWCNADQLQQIERAAACVAGIEVEGAGHPGVLIFTHGDVSLMRAFARELVDSAT